jgi:hypothetical protein
VLESELGKQYPEPDGCAGARDQSLQRQNVELGHDAVDMMTCF